MVYPRVGGGTRNAAFDTQSQTGLSPRGRGNPGHKLYQVAFNRSIPAWAGEPTSGR